MRPKPSGPIRVLILEEHPVVRDGLMQWLSHHTDVEACGQTTVISEAAAAVGRTRADVLLMDLMPHGADGLSFIRSLGTEGGKVRILVFSAHDERLYAERALRAGAMGYVARSAPESELLSALRTVAAGGIYLSPRLSLTLLGRLLRPTTKSTDKNGIASLTDRELHVFQLLGAGLGVREIGVRLGVSAKTAQAHRENIKNKLGFSNAAELLRHAALWLAQQGRDHGGRSNA